MAGFYGHGGHGYRGPHNPIPPGWLECPAMGEVSRAHCMIPMKVPLAPTHIVPNMAQLSGNAWTPQMALDMAHAKITAHNSEGVLAMVLDLTNSKKYYNPEVFLQSNVRYVKVPCRGRGESPDPLAVNMAAWEIRKTLAQHPHSYVLVHCTHGFNRSGFVIVSVAMRLLAAEGMCVERLLRRFAEQRPPGIYKHEYIDDLFRRHNELRPKVVKTPPLPAWKPADDEDEDDRPGYNNNAAAAAAAAKASSGRMTHSDKVGEAVCQEEARYVLSMTYDVLQGQDMLAKGQLIGGYPHDDLVRRGAGPGDFFIGSQPVSLDADNLSLVTTKRYFVTWKADGTRYLLLVTRWGTYLIDRAGEVRRLHMRFPSLQPANKKTGYPVGPPHDHTLLDGEMVVDDLDLEGQQQRRRYLVYDMMMLAGEGCCDLRFQDRYKLTAKEVVRPRMTEQEFYNAKRKDFPTFLYDWGLEAFSVRQKEFWPLNKAPRLLEAFIPRLCHESDGLILQPWDDPYIPRTYPHLLKWKFRHMNSVDFKLAAPPGQPVSLQLNCAMRRKRGTADVHHLGLQEIGLGEQRVEFPPGVDPTTLHGRIIECSFDVERRVWGYMRDRPDKLTANHRSVFEKVMTSITDNITEERLLAVFSDALQGDFYAEERAWLQQAAQPAAADQQPAAAAAAASQPAAASAAVVPGGHQQQRLQGQPPPAQQRHEQQQQQHQPPQQPPQQQQQQPGQLGVMQALQQRLMQQKQQQNGHALAAAAGSGQQQHQQPYDAAGAAGDQQQQHQQFSDDDDAMHGDGHGEDGAAADDDGGMEADHPDGEGMEAAGQEQEQQQHEQHEEEEHYEEQEVPEGDDGDDYRVTEMDADGGSDDGVEQEEI